MIQNDTKKTYGFILQIHSKVHKIKPFTSEHCIINSRGLLSNKDGFFFLSLGLFDVLIKNLKR